MTKTVDCFDHAEKILAFSIFMIYKNGAFDSNQNPGACSLGRMLKICIVTHLYSVLLTNTICKWKPAYKYSLHEMFLKWLNTNLISVLYNCKVLSVVCSDS